MNPIEKAYKAWRATLSPTPLTLPEPNGGAAHIAASGNKHLGRARIVRRNPRKYAGTGRYKRTAAHKEASRKGLRIVEGKNVVNWLPWLGAACFWSGGFLVGYAVRGMVGW